MTESNEVPGDRTRVHPEDRFAPPAQAFDRAAAVADLAREATTNTQGHRQKTLYRFGNSTLALFLFDAGGRMREHRTNGTVFIQILKGRMTIQAHDEKHGLSAGRVLVMSPGVPHDLYAEEPTQMLLTVSLSPNG